MTDKDKGSGATAKGDKTKNFSEWMGNEESFGNES